MLFQNNHLNFVFPLCIIDLSRDRIGTKDMFTITSKIKVILFIYSYQ